MIFVQQRLFGAHNQKRFLFSWVDSISLGGRVLHEDNNGLVALHKPNGKMCHPNVVLTNNNKYLAAHRIRTVAEECIFHSAVYDIEQEVFMPASLRIVKQPPSTIPPVVLDAVSAVSTPETPNIDSSPPLAGKPNPNFVWLLHRLDSATSGVLLVATNKTIAAAVKRAFKQRQNVTKTYVALVFAGTRVTTTGSSRDAVASSKALTQLLLGETMTWKDSISVDKSGAILRTHGASGTTSHGNNNTEPLPTLLAITEARILTRPASDDPLSLALIELRPSTGFTHQLRYQCAAHGLPIVGDKTYGDFAMNKIFKQAESAKMCNQHNATTGSTKKESVRNRLSPDRLYLHAHKIDLSYKLHNTEHRFAAVSPIPNEFHSQ